MSTLKKHLSTLLFLFFVLFFTSICILRNPSLVPGHGLASKRQLGSDLYFQDITSSRRRLTGPGSSPPRCAWKCGRCTPCKPVHVSVPPGTSVTEEYYPEAWRCKCGNRLYMP
ncbi:hypothetical protein SSX86_013190 [Deinandra increscens subsp. villosa]|uniref:Epidermal patterning factor-like protein n=1 Tax=Deinandra increscens subsp. villosa TaxID=3103831 RepID=A0AAP0H1K1_9ASTR